MAACAGRCRARRPCWTSAVSVHPANGTTLANGGKQKKPNPYIGTEDSWQITEDSMLDCLRNSGYTPCEHPGISEPVCAVVILPSQDRPAAERGLPRGAF